jgi:hypothetical protein
MRHQTTAYDSMRIARVKGERREVRKMLARRSRELLEKYRRGEASDAAAPWRRRWRRRRREGTSGACQGLKALAISCSPFGAKRLYLLAPKGLHEIARAFSPWHAPPALMPPSATR